MKKYGLILAVLAVAVLAACGTQTGSPGMSSSEHSSAAVSSSSVPAGTLPEDGEEYSFILASSATSEAVMGVTAQYFADLVNESSGGKVTIKTYLDMELGSDEELVKGTALGTVDMVNTSTPNVASVVPTFALFDLPNVFPDIDTAREVLRAFNEKMVPSMEGSGLHLCFMSPTAFRWMSCNRNIQSIRDFQGLRIRTMRNAYHMAYWESLGASAAPLTFSELYISLQQGLVNAQENPPDVFLDADLQDQQEYLVNTRHIVFIGTLLMNEEQWNQLPVQYQSFLEDCFEKAAVFGSEYGAEIESECVRQIEETGVEIVELNQTVLNQIIEKAQPVYDMIRETVGDDLVDEYLAAIRAAS